METLIGFVAGYIAGCQDGPDGVKRLRSTAESIVSSQEFRRLAAEAMSFAEMFVQRAASGGVWARCPEPRDGGRHAGAPGIGARQGVEGRLTRA